MRLIFTLVGLSIALSLSAQTTEKSVVGANGVRIGFLEFRPSDYAGAKHPLIIFLHGIGEKGNGTTQLRDVHCCGIPAYIRNGSPMRFTWMGKTESFVVLSPQCSEAYGAWQPFYTEEMIKYAVANLNIDPNRIFLTGLSMGGGGTWNYASASQANAEKLAGIAPVVAPCMMSNGCNIAKASLPVMAIHVLDDKDAPASCTTNALASINACNPLVSPNLIMYASGGHYVWVQRAFDQAHTYQDPNMFEFFLAQNKTFAPNKKPVANAGKDVALNIKTGSLTVSAGGSSDPDGSIVKYIWRKVSGPAGGAISDPYKAAPTITGLTIKGNYVFEVKVVDNRAEWSVDNITIAVGDGAALPNLAPSANAGGNISITLPTNSVNLSGSGSSDPDGSITAWNWSKTNGPAATIASAGSANTAVTGLVQGTYAFTLKVTDDKGLTSTDEVTVIVNAAGTPTNPSANANPVAKAGNDVTITLPTNTVTLNGNMSTDADGSISNYLWTKTSGPAASIASSGSVNTAINNLVQGSYVFNLKVTDDKGATGFDEVKVTVNAAGTPTNPTDPTVPSNPGTNTPPVAKAGADLVVTLPTTTATLYGSSSYDPDGSISAYQWTKTSGPSATINAPTLNNTNLKNLSQGTYVFSLKVTDNKGAIAIDEVTVTVRAANSTPNKAPDADAGSDLTIVLPSNSATLSGNLSADADGNIRAYLWTKLSGPEADITSPTSAVSQVTGLEQGVYVFSLKVTDDDDAESTDEVTISVVKPAPPPNLAPLAEAGKDTTTPGRMFSFNLDGSASRDTDGSIASYRWKELSGPSTADIVDTTKAITTISKMTPGKYVFELRVTDDKGASSRDTVSISFTGLLDDIEKIVAFPNPTHGSMNLAWVNSAKGRTRIVIYDATGMEVYSKMIVKTGTGFQQPINTAGLKAGTYFITTVSEKGTTRMLSSFIKLP